MTYEEAIEILRDTPIDIRSAREDDIHTLYATAQMMAIEALEKQIPKKPKWIYGKDMGIAECSVCGKELHYYMKGCPKCLNAIDWGGDE